MRRAENILITDIETLIKLRFDYISQETELSQDEKNRLAPYLREYFTKHLSAGDFIAYGIRVDGEIASIAFLSISERPPGIYFLNGRIGTVVNVLTYPKYRKKGYGKPVMSELIRDAELKSVSVLDLLATEMGIPLYAWVRRRPVQSDEVENAIKWLKKRDMGISAKFAECIRPTRNSQAKATPPIFAKSVLHYPSIVETNWSLNAVSRI